MRGIKGDWLVDRVHQGKLMSLMVVVYRVTVIFIFWLCIDDDDVDDNDNDNYDNDAYDIDDCDDDDYNVWWW